MAEDENKQGDLKYYQNQPYDMEVDLNNEEEEGEANNVNTKKKPEKEKTRMIFKMSKTMKNLVPQPK